MDVAKSGDNIQQRVFDAFPDWPGLITLESVCAALPFFDQTSVRNAVNNLRRCGIVEKDQRGSGSYRLRKNARRPVDMRGHHSKGGPKRAHQ